ncbi:MAG: glycoside hydrolase family 3 C-terminal domain-containing protein, partial [Bacteroidales bacterium]|nr:glycoside hydrolase family 3 C-terminal domain-containing protein [Bacteroidales bacterium]
AGALSIMGAYNRFDGKFCCENPLLLKTVLRDEWGFRGFVMSDFVNGVHSAEGSLPAGLDMEMMFTMHYSAGKIKKGLKKGTIRQEDIDSAVSNILRASLLQFPKIQPRDKAVVGSRAHRDLALEIAQKGMVLLKNDGVLPLAPETKVQVTGPYADIANVGDHGSSRIWDREVITPLEGLGRFFPVSASEGDVAVICVGSNAEKEGEFFASMKEDASVKPAHSGGDRANLRLEPEEVELIRSLKEQGRKTVVVLYSGAAILTGDWQEWADAIVMNFYSGCEGPVALGSLLRGDVNFSGHLPFTVARSEEDYPPFLSIGERPYEIEYGYYHGYALLDKEGKTAEYPFGYGLSYTTFALGESTAVLKGESVVVRTPVTNTGARSGAAVVQVYAGSQGSALGEDRPHKQLKGFSRVEVKPSETVQAEVRIPLAELRFRRDGSWVMDDAYNFYIGTDSEQAENCKLLIPVLFGR